MLATALPRPKRCQESPGVPPHALIAPMFLFCTYYDMVEPVSDTS
jgi:hypothetical protein